jgi:Protein of unknown function (DUF2844)
MKSPEIYVMKSAKAGGAMRSLSIDSTATRALVCTFLVVLSTPAFAVLGDNAASVLTDQGLMKGTLHSVDKSAYVVHEITTSYGSRVREFVSPTGVVFAVVWDGRFPPNFQQLLGPYYRQAQEASGQQQSPHDGGQRVALRRGSAVIDTPGLVLVQVGHSRSFHGRAYIPQLIPQGVSTSDIR